MSALDTLLAVEAFVSGTAQRRATVRHRHLDSAPMVIVAYQMAGEAGAPLGMMYGTMIGESRLLVAPEPRNREIRFREVFNPFAEDFVNWLDTYSERDPEDQCVRCPQILVPNRGTLEFVGSVLGRSLRYLRSSTDFFVPDPTITLGAHATWFAQQSETPGSCVLVAATDLLRRHWATGQSGLEDEDLHVLLSWIDPPNDQSGRAAAAQMEADRVNGIVPSAGPTPDPSWDRDILEPLLDSFNTARGQDASPAVVASLSGPTRSAVGKALGHAWRSTWRAHHLLSELQVGASVPHRWASDSRTWTSHLTRVEQNRAFFRTRDSARQSAWMIKSREDAQQALELAEVLDDPMTLAGLVADGEALHGEIVDIDRDHREVPPGGTRPVVRQLISLELPEPCALPQHTILRWTDRMQLETELMRIDGRRCVLKVVAGMRGDIPETGMEASFVALEHRPYPMPSTVPGIPWTHQGADAPEPDTEVPE